jgi:hypothetical protein
VYLYSSHVPSLRRRGQFVNVRFGYIYKYVDIVCQFIAIKLARNTRHRKIPIVTVNSYCHNDNDRTVQQHPFYQGVNQHTHTFSSRTFWIINLKWCATDRFTLIKRNVLSLFFCFRICGRCVFNSLKPVLCRLTAIHTENSITTQSVTLSLGKGKIVTVPNLSTVPWRCMGDWRCNSTHYWSQHR